MTTKIVTKKSTKNDAFSVLDLKVRGELTTYKAIVGGCLVRGITKGGRKAVKELLARMSSAKADLVDTLKELADRVVDYVVEAVKSGVIETGVLMGTYFHIMEYMGVVVKIQRISRPYGVGLWVEIKAMFKGYDGYLANSKHVVVRFMEIYQPNKISRDKLLKAVYGTMRIAFNAYGGIRGTQ